MAEGGAAPAPPGEGTPDPKVRLRGVQKTFVEPGKAPVEVLTRVDLDVAEGEFVCLLGPSGCGKSTVLNLCAGFVTCGEGTIEIDAQPVRGPDPRRVFVFQEYGIFPWMTVRENIAFGLGNHPHAETSRIVRHYIALVGLTDFEEAYPHELSGGMKQRVEVARALAVNPDILFMDEPFGALDSLTRIHMRAELIRIWKSEKKTILFVTHDIEESVQLGQRVVVFTDRPASIKTIFDLSHLGHPRDLDSPEYLRARDLLFETMGVPTRI